ncbi:MAG TPA: hypothetical protein VFQ66_10085 [Candidatus Limnocylindria bacterium]|nr:hypothetical protein [Candidatus Limnocylindria bacterium]
MSALKIVGVLLIVAVAYVAAGAMLLNNASAAYFPRQLTVLLVTTAAASLASVGLWRTGRLLLLAVAAISAAGLVSHPSLHEVRLQALARAVPVTTSAGATPGGAARCFCATRASLLELFGAPDFVGDGERGTARLYAYTPDRSSGRLVIYELSGRSGAEDRVIAIREESAAPGSLGLSPW